MIMIINYIHNMFIRMLVKPASIKRFIVQTTLAHTRNIFL